MEEIIWIIGIAFVIFIFFKGLEPNMVDDPNEYWEKDLFKKIDTYRKSQPIADEDPFKSSKYSSQKILKSKEKIKEIKSYWKENKEKLKGMPFMNDELYESTDKELNN